MEVERDVEDHKGKNLDLLLKQEIIKYKALNKFQILEEIKQQILHLGDASQSKTGKSWNSQPIKIKEEKKEESKLKFIYFHHERN